MSDHHNDFLNPWQPWMRMWTDAASKMMSAGQPPAETPPDMARQMRSAWLDAYSQFFESYFRSPDFLEMMRQSLSASVQARKQLNDFLGQAQHELQGTSRQDIDQLMRTMRHVEHRVVNSIERLADQVEDVAARLRRLERAAASNGRTPEKTKKKKSRSSSGPGSQ